MTSIIIMVAQRLRGKYVNNGGYAWCGNCGERKAWTMKRCDECNRVVRHRRRNKIRVKCECGCGGTVDKYRKTDPYHYRPRRYINGHQRRGVKISADQLSKLIAGNKAKPRTQACREWMRKFRLGKKHTDETKHKISQAMRQVRLGTKLSQETRHRISQSFVERRRRSLLEGNGNNIIDQK
jgi:hypothetical protein